MRIGAWLLTLASLLGALLISAGPGWIEGDMFALLPEQTRDKAVTAALEHVQQSTLNQVLVLTQALSSAGAARAANAYAKVLRDSPSFRHASAKPPVSPRAVADFYTRYRFQLLSRAQRETLRNTPVEALAERALRRAYAAPGQVSGREIATDPLSLFRNALQSLRPAKGWSLENGTPVRETPSGYVGVARGVLAASPFALNRQPALSATLDAAAAAAHRATPGVALLTAGVAWHALAQSRQARSEVSTVGLGSLIAVIALIIVVFRSARPLLVGALSLAAGGVAALSVTQLVFGQVHLFTLVFGASLIGVAIDYNLHVFADRFGHVGPWTARAAVQRLRPGLGLALATTVLGYAALALTPLPGLRQIACFSAVGLIAAWISVVLFAPVLGGGGDGRRAPRVAEWTEAGLRRIYRKPVPVALLVLALAIPGWLGVHFSDDIRALHSSLPQRAAMEQRVRSLLGAADANQFFLVAAPDTQTLLEREARLGRRLNRLQANGALERWRGVVQAVPAPAQQFRNYQLLTRKVFGPGGAAPVAWRRLGFSEAHIQEQRALFNAAASRRLTLEAWLDSPAGRPWRHLWLGKLPGNRVGTVVLLGGVNDFSALRGLELPGVAWVDPVSDLTAVLTVQRHHVTLFLLAAYLLIGLVLAYVYGVRGGLRATFPPAAASALAVAGLGWAGEPLDLFALFALLLVLGIGVDYTIFFREARGAARRTGAWSAVSLSALTTALSFGLLAASHTPAIHRFGYTLLIGIGAAWALSPLAQSRTSLEKNDA